MIKKILSRILSFHIPPYKQFLTINNLDIYTPIIYYGVYMFNLIYLSYFYYISLFSYTSLDIYLIV